MFNDGSLGLQTRCSLLNHYCIYWIKNFFVISFMTFASEQFQPQPLFLVHMVFLLLKLQHLYFLRQNVLSDKKFKNHFSDLTLINKLAHFVYIYWFFQSENHCALTVFQINLWYDQHHEIHMRSISVCLHFFSFYDV